MKTKKIIPIALLVALLIWGIYSVGQKNNENNSAVENSNNSQVKTNKSVEASTGIEKGDMAPDFKLTTLDGKQVQLSDYRGKKVILNFWATWCPPCKAEILDLEKFYSSYKGKNAVILGVDLTQSEKSQNAVVDFVKSYGITYPVSLDVESTVSGMYQVSAIPTSYIIDTRGIINGKVVGPMDFDTMKNMLSAIN